MTAISDSGDAYWQNVGDVAAWTRQVERGILPVARGIQLDDDDRRRREIINALMCRGEVDLGDGAAFASEHETLSRAPYDELVTVDDGRLVPRAAPPLAPSRFVSSSNCRPSPSWLIDFFEIESGDRRSRIGRDEQHWSLDGPLSCLDTCKEKFMNKFDVGAQVTRALLVGLALMAGCIDGSDDAIEEVAGEETTSTEHALASDPAGPDIAAILAAAGVPVDGEPNDLEEVHAEALSTVGVGDLNIGTGDTAFGQDVLGQPISDTTTVFEDVYPSTDAVVQETAEGVRLISVIRDAAAPTEFVYTFGDVTLTRNEATGAIEISRDGVNQGFIDLAWAVDAAGTEVPTEYEIQGSTLVQIVNHTGAQYPVVADPNVKRNCGIITCTWYFTKWYTKHVLKESTAPVLGSTIMCGALINPPVVAVCAAYVFAHGAFAVLKINEAAAANKCFTAAYTALGGSFHIGTSNDRRYCANR